MENETLQFAVAEDDAGTRLDVFLAGRLPVYSRSHLRQAITHGAAAVDGQTVKPSFRVRSGQQVVFAPPDLPRVGPQPENIPLDILFEDQWLAVVNKPAGMVVHPAKGHWQGTLTAALAHHFTSLSSVGGPTRPGIVHRLDRDTSGVMVIAKSDRAHLELAAQFEARTVEKEYLAIVVGNPDRDRDVIDQPIGPHPYQREKMAIRDGHPQSRGAQTIYEVTERFGRFAAVRVLPKTGRTHQIRIHLAHIGHPVLCDRLYSGRARITWGELQGGASADNEPDTGNATLVLERQALHASRLVVKHPHDGQPLTFTAPPPSDIQAVLSALRNDELSRRR